MASGCQKNTWLCLQIMSGDKRQLRSTGAEEKGMEKQFESMRKFIDGKVAELKQHFEE